jgi:hypothetical protein
VAQLFEMCGAGSAVLEEVGAPNVNGSCFEGFSVFCVYFA